MNRRAIAIVACMAVISLCTAPLASASVWPSTDRRVALSASRVTGTERYSTAVAIAGKAYPAWNGISHVVLASGDDRYAADPVMSASLCWAYDAPLLLTSTTVLPAVTKRALAAIVSANTTVTVHVVGGTGPVPAGQITEIRALLGAAGTVERPWPQADRYAVAQGIANRVRLVAQETSRTIPDAVFIANGANPSTYWDAIAASAISRYTGIPILMTGATTVPVATTAALKSFPTAQRIVVGGTASVSAGVFDAVHAHARWGGSNRFTTACEVALGATAAGWTRPDTAGVAVGMSDAVAASGLIGRGGGILLFSERDRLNRTSWKLLSNPTSTRTRGFLFGPAHVASPGLLAELNGAAALPALKSNAPTTLVGKSMRVAGAVGGNSTRVTLLINGVKKGSRDVLPWGYFDFGTVTAPTSSVKIGVVASNPDSKSATLARTVARLSHPYATCIVIDKSDFKLYWVRNNYLVKVYPIAIGRPGMETPVATWKILAKYKTNPTSVYGPRKMRMFKHVGSNYVYTAYAVHGTNEPWVIGTKASHGCIRMYNRDVLELWPQVPLGTMVITRQ